MAKFSRLERSNRAHERLIDKHSGRNANLAQYHQVVLDLQEAEKRVYSHAEKKRVYVRIFEASKRYKPTPDYGSALVNRDV